MSTHSRSRREPWRLVLGYGSDRLWRKFALALSVTFLFVAPVSCYLAEGRRAARTFDAVGSRVSEMAKAAADLERSGPKPGLTGRVPEAAFAYVEERTYAIRWVAGNVQLLRNADFLHDSVAVNVAERALRRGTPALTPRAGSAGFLRFTPSHAPAAGTAARPSGWVVTAFRIEDLLRAAEPRDSITFDVYEAGTRSRLATAQAPGEGAGNLLLTFARRVRVDDQVWIIYQNRYRPLGAAFLSPANSIWLFGSLACALGWLLSRRRRSIEVGASVLDTMVDVVLVIDAAMTIRYASPSVTGALGYAPDELSAKTLADFFHPDDMRAAKTALQKSRLTGDAVFIERLRICAKDGSWRAVSGTARRLMAGTVVDHLVTLHDVTNLLGLERQLEAADRVQSLGRVAANVTHEFRNILMALDINLELLGRSTSDPKAVPLIETLRRYVRRGSGVSDEILRFAAPTPLKVTTIDARRWLDQLEHDLLPLLVPKAALTTRMDAPLVFQGDEDRLSQVLMNFILNSRDAIRDRGHVECVVSHSHGGSFPFGIVPPGDFAHVTVEDDGEGMSEETARRMFEPLFTTKRKGTGLGLAISKQIVAAHHGLLFAESDPGKGTIMHMFLPIEAPSLAVN